MQTAIKANMKKRQQNMQIYFIVSVVAILCYINSLSGDFVHDDLPAIVYNRDVLGTSSLSEMLLNDFWGMRMKLKESHKSYRPLTTLTFRYFHSFPPSLVSRYLLHCHRNHIYCETTSPLKTLNFNFSLFYLVSSPSLD